MRRRAWAGARAATPRTRRAPAAYEGAWMSPFSSRWSSRIVAISATRAGSSAARLERESAPTGRCTMGRCSTGGGAGPGEASTRARPRAAAAGERGRTERPQTRPDRRASRLEPVEVRDEQRAVVFPGGQVRQRPAEPRAHLGRREAGGVDAGELRLEVVRLVDDQETAPPESLGVPVAERGEVGGVGAEDRRPEGGRLGADVRALAEWAAAPAAGAARGRDVRAGIAVARAVVAALHQPGHGPELALVLILEQLLRGQQVGVTAPPRERHRDVALAHARRPLD